MKDYIEFKKNGCFYYVYNDDTYILFYLFKYKIINNRVGFNKRSINTVINKLEYYKINYKLDKIIKYNNNKYQEFKNKGLNKYIEYMNIRNLEDKIMKMNNKDINDLYNLLKKNI